MTAVCVPLRRFSNPHQHCALPKALELGWIKERPRRANFPWADCRILTFELIIRVRQQAAGPALIGQAGKPMIRCIAQTG